MLYKLPYCHPQQWLTCLVRLAVKTGAQGSEAAAPALEEPAPAAEATPQGKAVGVTRKAAGQLPRTPASAVRKANLSSPVAGSSASVTPAVRVQTPSRCIQPTLTPQFRAVGQLGSSYKLPGRVSSGRVVTRQKAGCAELCC